MAPRLLALVKHDCPVCIQLLPALDGAAAAGAPLRIVSQSAEDDTSAMSSRLRLASTIEVDSDLAISAAFDPEAVPAVILLDGDDERDRVEGLDTERLRELAAAAGVTLQLNGLPAMRPGCASRTRDPVIAPQLAARAARASGRLQARTIEIGAHEDVYEALIARGLSDGLPLVPPTAERVVAALDHTSRHPQDVVGTVPPYGGTATVEKVAINAVMAGCPGETLPIVLAAVEAACDESFAMHGLLATTYPAGPLVVISGPLATRAGMNSAGNCLGQGNRANTTIGRALQLVVRNVGGGRPQHEDRATHGQPGKLSACFAERMEDSPWPPLSVDRGFAADDTTVTLFAAEAPRVVVDQLARDPDGLCHSLALALDAIAHPKLRFIFDAVLVIGPEHARVFAEAGWSKDTVRARLHAFTERPAAELVRGAGGSPEGLDGAFATNGEAMLAKFVDPSRIAIVHAGGDAGLFSMVYGLWVSGDVGSTPVTRSVTPWT
jgi:hypothetical protein